MQIRSGTAQILSSNVRRVRFTGLSAADAALLGTGQFFQFVGESGLFFTTTSVISAVPASAEIELVSPGYNGAKPLDTLAGYLIWKDFSPKGFILPEPSDVDIRSAITYNANLTDTLLDTAGGGGGGGNAFDKSGNKDVTAGAFAVTVTPPAGTFPTPPYGVMATANWPTWIGWRGQLTTSFVLDFAVGAPASAKVSWGVFTL
jgi:hypothetical protein